LIPSTELSSSAQQFIQSVLDLRARVAVFDCDGTLWGGDAGADFFYWEIEQGLVPKGVAEWALPRYRDYKAGLVDEEVMCGEMVTINAGKSLAELEAAAARFFAAHVEHRIFRDMQQLTHALTRSGCEVWAVSSSNEWMIREGVKRFGIPPERVLAAAVHMDDGRASGRLIRVPTDEGKARVLRAYLSTPPELCFGNSIHDAAMLELSRRAFAVNPNPDLEQLALKKKWTIYWPEGSRSS